MMLSRYFWDGFRHAAFGGGFALLFYAVTRVNYFKKSDYWLGLIMTSSAFFFLPGHIGRYGSFLDRAYQFLHYPVSDWDILLFGMNWHRFFITHSLLIPAAFLIMLLRAPIGYRLSMGASVGLSSHLVWDALTCSMRTPVVFFNNIFEVRGYWGKGWLIANGLLLFWFAWHVHRKTLDKEQQKTG